MAQSVTMKQLRVGRPKGENTANAARRRKQLIDAAIESIVENGLANTTLATVSKASGLSQGTAVFYFTSKEALLYETFRYRLDEYRTALMNALDSAGSDPVDRVVARAFAAIDPQLLTRRDLAFWSSFWPEASRNATLNAISKQYDAERQKVMLSLCEDAQAYIGDSSIWTPELVAAALETMIEGVWSRLHYSSAHLTVSQARLLVGSLLATVFRSRSEAILKRATGA